MKLNRILRGIFFATAILFSGIVSSQDIINLTHKGNASTISFGLSENLKPIAHMVARAERVGPFRENSLFRYVGTESARSESARIVRKAVILQLDHDKVKNILTNSEERILLEIPVSANKNIRILLVKSEIHGPGFKVSAIDENGKNSFDITSGVHYRGIVEGDPNSIAAFSIFEGSVMGMICDKNGNYVVGALGNDRSDMQEYILYNDKDLIIKPSFRCDTEEGEPLIPKKFLKKFDLKIPDDSQYATLPVNIYFECDYAMYLDNGSNVAKTKLFTEGMFNQVATIYQNEQIPIAISEIVVWTIQDSYPVPDPLTPNFEPALQAFGAKIQNNFKGHLAHLLSRASVSGLGGRARHGVLCATYDAQTYKGPFAYCNIANSYKEFPTYSFTVLVVAHEMGHNFGSEHTHWCGWELEPGKFGAIDWCGPTANIKYKQGDCNPASLPPQGGGTIMSYCHISSLNIGTNLSNGFGPLPGNVIRQGYQNALNGCVQVQCPQGPALSLVGQTISTGIRAFQSGSTITAPSSGTFTVQSTADVTMTAGGTITLNPPFNVINGGEFIAYSDNCMAGLPAPPDNDVWIKTLESYEGAGLENFGKAETVLVYPNPSSGLFTFEYTLEAETEVSLSVYDMQGKKVEQLLNKSRQKAGTHRASFDASKLKNDVYMYLLETGTRKESGKLLKAR